MQTAFTAREVGQSNLVQVLPLLRLGCDAAEAADWAHLVFRQFMGGIRTRPDTGLVVAEDQNGYIGGVFCYRIVHEMPASQTFDCQKIVVPDLVRAHKAFAMLVGEAEQMARDRECTRLRIALTFLEEPEIASGPPLIDHLREGGFKYDSIHYAKDLTQPDDQSRLEIVNND
jgi:hypothetical protein